MEDEYYEPPVSRMLRGKALDKAISAYAAIVPHSTFDPNTTHSDLIIDVADKFYQFLKGEDK